MKRRAREVIRSCIRSIRVRKSRDIIDTMMSHQSARLSAVGAALRDSLDNNFACEESTMMSRIEQRRLKLLKSGDDIDVIDYGAGSPGSNRTEAEMRRGVECSMPVARICRASKPPFWCRLLFGLIRNLKPSSCLELGTCVGISAAYQAAALAFNGGGKLVTLEGDPNIANIAQETLNVIQQGNTSVIIGPFHDTLPSALERARPVDYLFNDGHHDHDALLRYFDEAEPYLADEAVVVFDDISWSEGMKQAWNDIKSNARVAATIDLGEMGIAVLSVKSKGGNNYSIPL